MVTQKRQQFIHAQLAWMLGVIILLGVLGSLSLELFFVLSLIGFLIVIELTASPTITPPWRTRLFWFVALGLTVFGIIVIRRILEILPAEVLPW